MFKVKYTKLFVNGTLEGMTFDDEISCPTLESAAKIVGNMSSDRVVEAIGGSDYVCLCSRIVVE